MHNTEKLTQMESTIVSMSFFLVVALMVLLHFCFPGRLLLVPVAALLFSLVGALGVVAYWNLFGAGNAISHSDYGTPSSGPHPLGDVIGSHSRTLWAKQMIEDAMRDQARPSCSGCVGLWLAGSLIPVVIVFFCSAPRVPRSDYRPVEPIFAFSYPTNVSARTSGVSVDFRARTYARNESVSLEVSACVGHKNRIRKVELHQGINQNQVLVLADTGVNQNPFGGIQSFRTLKGGVIPLSVKDSISVSVPLWRLTNSVSDIVVAGWDAFVMPMSHGFNAGAFEKHVAITAVPFFERISQADRFVVSSSGLNYPLRTEGGSYLILGREVKGPYQDAQVLLSSPPVFLTRNQCGFQVHDGEKIYGPYQAIGCDSVERGKDGRLMFVAQQDGLWFPVSDGVEGEHVRTVLSFNPSIGIMVVADAEGSYVQHGPFRSKMYNQVRSVGLASNDLPFFIGSCQTGEVVVVGQWQSASFRVVEELTTDSEKRRIVARVRSGWTRYCLEIDPTTMAFNQRLSN